MKQPPSAKPGPPSSWGSLEEEEELPEVFFSAAQKRSVLGFCC